MNRNLLEIYIYIFGGLVLWAGPIFSQSHEINMSIGGGLSTLNYRTANGLSSRPCGGGSLGVGYAYFFSPDFSVSTGVDFTLSNGRLAAPLLNDSITNLTDVFDVGQPFNFRYSMKNFEERHQLMMLSVPLMMNYYFGNRPRFYISLGGKVAFPLSARYTASSSEFRTSAFYPDYDITFDALEGWGFGRYTTRTRGKLQFNTAYMLAAEAGSYFFVSRGVLLYIGLYIDYGLNPISPPAVVSEAMRPFTGTPGIPRDNHEAYYGHNTMLASANTAGHIYAERAVPLAIGLKLRIALSPQTAPSSRDGNNRQIASNRSIHNKNINHSFGDRLKDIFDGKPAPIAKSDNTAVARNRPKAEPSKPDKEIPPEEKAEFEMTISGFNVSGAKLTPEATASLDRKIAFLKKYPHVHITIEGHTDSTGSDNANSWVGKQRALAARNYLVSHGINGAHISIVNKGSSEPIAPNDTEENRAKNRRVKMIVK